MSIVETVAAAEGKLPWGAFGKPINNKMSPEEMLKSAGLDWSVGLYPAYTEFKGKKVVISGKRHLLRESDGQPLTTCSPRWKPVQNEESVKFFKKYMVSGQMTMEHLGSLMSGQYVWALAKLNKSFSLGKEDVVRGYVLFLQPHKQGKAMVIQHLSMREWCWNSLASKLGKQGEDVFRMAHTKTFDEVIQKEAQVTLGLAVKQMEAFHKQATLLSNKKATEKEMETYFCEVLRFDPKDKDNKVKKDGGVREPLMLPHFRDALVSSPGQHLPSAKGTWWGALNAVTFVIDHSEGRGEQGTALRSAWAGRGAKLKMRALDLALDAAGKGKAAATPKAAKAAAEKTAAAA